MTARKRREREVERMARRIMKVGDENIGSGRQWERSTETEQRFAYGVARYVLRLLAAERRKAWKRVHRINHARFHWPENCPASDEYRDAILNGGRK